MENILSFVTLIFILYIGFALLALSQDRNWRQVVTTPPPSRAGKIFLRTVGSVLLALGLRFALVRDGPGFGSLLWGTMISVAACAVTLTLSWRPQLLKPLAHAIHVVASLMNTTMHSSCASIRMPIMKTRCDKQIKATNSAEHSDAGGARLASSPRVSGTSQRMRQQ